MRIRKKLSMTIAGLVVASIAGWLGTRNIEMSPEIQTAFITVIIFVIGSIIKSFNIGQGLADQGKEAIKTILVGVLAANLFLLPVFNSVAYAQDNTCPDMLTECTIENGQMGNTIKGFEDTVKDLELENKVCNIELKECEENQDKLNPLMVFDFYAKLPKAVRLAILGLLTVGLTYAADQINIDETQ